MRLFVVIGALLCAALPAPAFADWGWTSWDMSAKQVVSGSDGKVHAQRGDKDDQVDSWDLMAEGQVEQDGFKFRAQFYFDKRGKALHVIRLTLLDYGQCSQLADLVRSRQGTPPTDYSNTLPTDDGKGYRITNWEWAKDGEDVLGLTQAPPRGSFEGLCILVYWRPGDTSAT